MPEILSQSGKIKLLNGLGTVPVRKSGRSGPDRAYSLLGRFSRRFISRSIPSRITSRRASPSPVTASSRSTVLSVNGNVSLTGHCFFLPTVGAVS